LETLRVELVDRAIVTNPQPWFNGLLPLELLDLVQHPLPKKVVSICNSH
jgi:hypothetical protein